LLAATQTLLSGGFQLAVAFSVNLDLSASGAGLVNANYRVLVPSNTDVLMKVWYRGHKSWYYPGTTEKAQSRPLNLKPGEETKIDIRLEPDPTAPLEGCGMPVGTVVNP
jgi:hypothetical protein